MDEYRKMNHLIWTKYQVLKKGVNEQKERKTREKEFSAVRVNCAIFVNICTGLIRCCNNAIMNMIKRTL